jgi:hypothetical protein
VSAGEFGWQQTKDGRVRITWRGRVVTTLAGGNAARFLRQADGADDETVQGLLSRGTGNFKRGNERRPL